MKLAYVEDDVIARAIFAKKLRGNGISCEEFSEAEEAISRIQPGSHDVLVIDIRLPDMSGVELLSRLRLRQIHAPCILITAFNNLEYAREAFQASASYLLEKPFSFKALIGLIHKVFEAPGTLQHCVDRGLVKLNLKSREEEVARYLLKGLSNAEISRNVGISEKTAKHYITLIFEKAGVSSRSEFFSYIFPV